MISKKTLPWRSSSSKTKAASEAVNFKVKARKKHKNQSSLVNLKLLHYNEFFYCFVSVFSPRTGCRSYCRNKWRKCLFSILFSKHVLWPDRSLDRLLANQSLKRNLSVHVNSTHCAKPRRQWPLFPSNLFEVKVAYTTVQVATADDLAWFISFFKLLFIIKELIAMKLAKTTDIKLCCLPTKNFFP